MRCGPCRRPRNPHRPRNPAPCLAREAAADRAASLPPSASPLVNRPPRLQVSTSALEACAKYWPELFGGLGEEERQRMRRGLRATRPRLIKGWEALVMARLVLEDDRWGWGQEGAEE